MLVAFIDALALYTPSMEASTTNPQNCRFINNEFYCGLSEFLRENFLPMLKLTRTFQNSNKH